jgi:hypothetical protein
MSVAAAARKRERWKRRLSPTTTTTTDLSPTPKSTGRSLQVRPRSEGLWPSTQAEAFVKPSRARDAVANILQPCDPTTLAPGAILSLNPTLTMTLTDTAVFTPACTGTVETDATGSLTNSSFFADNRDPFYASMTPQVYATGAATVLSWMLVLTLLITPRTFFVGGPGGRSGLLGRNGMISGATGGASVIGVGSRPWLQKVAALTCAISLTIATADTFKVAEQQYQSGFMDASVIRSKVVAGLEIKISRVVSDIFLWLAQVQTLIRLFPRHKEKVIIKWVGFALIILDMVFSCINASGGYNVGRPQDYDDPIPALNYLFQIALSILYAMWVLYYAYIKRQYAFYHRMMWNVSLVAFISVIAVLTPVIFFALDISNEDIAGWGDYFRWVGAAAASVIVWEWVERIEAIEREEKKDGILGREIFDGDDVIEVSAWDGPDSGSGDLRNRRHKGDDDLPPDDKPALTKRQKVSRALKPVRRLGHIDPYVASNIPLQDRPKRMDSDDSGPPFQKETEPREQTVQIPPRAASTPGSRTDTTSAASTVYAVRYHPNSESHWDPSESGPGPIARSPIAEDSTEYDSPRLQSASSMHTYSEQDRTKLIQAPSASVPRNMWNSISRTIFRHDPTPPPEVVRSAQEAESMSRPQPAITPQPQPATGIRGLRSRIGMFAAEQGDRFRDRRGGHPDDTPLPVTVIPAQRRGPAWTPEALSSEQGSSGWTRLGTAHSAHDSGHASEPSPTHVTAQAGVSSRTEQALAPPQDHTRAPGSRDAP